MTDLSDSYDPMVELEAMVRAAGQYVQASDDLRPRVLETARTQRGEQRAQRWIRRLACCVVLLTGMTASVGDRGELNGGSQRFALAVDPFFQPASNTSAVRVDAGWGVVEAFTELRRQQSEMLRLSM